MSTTPAAKKLRTDTNQEQVYNHVIQQLIIIHNSFNEKVKHLEAKIDTFVSDIRNILSENLLNEKRMHCCDKVFEKLYGIERIVQNISSDKSGIEEERQVGEVPVVLLPTYKPLKENEGDSTIQVITLNNEADYPNGSWLGDDRSPEARVRVPITPSQLLHINTVCPTPEKMAIMLLDHLFDQEVQARSNLSGKGKHFKQQLDPLKIYGIKAHLKHKFYITERDWYRIKQNIDSKCRTAWRKKSMGLPLSRKKVKTNRDTDTPTKILTGDSIVLAGAFIKEETSQELASLIVDDKDCYTLTGCCEQTLTIITDSGEVSVPILSAEDSLSDDHTTSDILGLSSHH